MTTSEHPGDFDVDYELTRFLRESRHHAMGRLSEIHQDLDYNSFLLLVAIDDAEPGVRASDLAERLRVHKSTISRAVSALERLGLIERAIHPDDGRAQLLRIRPDAKERLDAFRIKSHAWLDDLLSTWSEEDRSSFGTMLSRLNSAAGRGYAGVVAVVTTMVEDLEPLLMNFSWL
jgi:DNA-binding MarR family transcriptional regulator